MMPFVQEDYYGWRQENVSILGELNTELQKTASLEQLNRKLDTKTFDRHWKSLLSSIERKADDVDLQGVSTRLNRVEDVSESGRWSLTSLPP